MTTSDRVPRSEREAYKPLEEYGIVGNLETTALVGRDGSIDWCCFPHVESPSVFARILDADRGGYFTITPAESFEAKQTYRERTNVLETQFETDDGRATVTDFMPIPGETVAEDHRAIYRRLTGDNGEVDLVAEFAPRFDYAETVPTVESTGDGVDARGDGETLSLSSSVPLTAADGTAAASFALREGETQWFVLGYDLQVPRRPDDHRDHLDAVVEYWRDWVHTCSDRSSCSVDGPWHDLAVRSGLLLKLLIHRGTGAICAAPTTSLPEVIGGVRNWDYRYNWIRDAAFTVEALAELGHIEEARDYFTLCLSHCSQGTPAEMQPLYGLHGGTDLEERTLDHLSGYRNSAPVRVGNDAASQRQLDVYGELVVGVYEILQYGEDLRTDHWEFIRDIVDYVADVWDERDVGIWEMRDSPEHFVYSKVMCWAALDRGIKLVDETDFDGPVDRWEGVREEIREAVLERGYNDEMNSFVRSFGSDDRLDAATLRLPAVDFLPADDPRIQGTIDAVLDRLTTSDGLVTRVEGDDGLPGEEGKFVVCSFWLIDALALAGRVDEAESLFGSVCEFVSPLGLLAEEVDADTGEQLGNVPQAFSQIGLINTAISLTEQDANVASGAEDYRSAVAFGQPTRYPGMRDPRVDDER